jgi:hypothetical protein
MKHQVLFKSETTHIHTGTPLRIQVLSLPEGGVEILLLDGDKHCTYWMPALQTSILANRLLNRSYTDNPAASGAGKSRSPYIIREHLAGLGLTMEDVARDLGVSGTLVRETVRGRYNNSRVLSKLRELGVPDAALSLPPELQGAA